MLFLFLHNRLSSPIQKSHANIEHPIMKKFLITGLGNPGVEYEHTRHNIGFEILDHFAKEENLNFEAVKYGWRADFKLKGRLFILLKPNTMMNLSGRAVQYWLQQEKIPLENLLVIVDDLHIPFGEIRLKAKGSDGGHNGLKDIQKCIETSGYNRFRFGIGNTYKQGSQVHFVLGKWSVEEQEKLKERLPVTAELIKSFGLAGLNETMNAFNRK